MYNKVYNIEWQKYVTHMLPIRWRKSGLVAYARSLLQPLVDIHQSFLRFRKDAIYRVVNTSQVCYIKKVLNDKFDSTARRITLEDAAKRTPPYVYTPNEEKPLHVYTEVEAQPIYLYPQEYYVDANVEFYVVVPVGLRPQNLDARKAYEASVIALVSYYKLVAKRFSIKYQIP